jgi:2-iminobutanoate/2-iminopropanoate deaminase
MPWIPRALCALPLVLAALWVSAAPPAPVQYLPSSTPNAPFSAAVRVGDMLYLSGQIGLAPDGTLPPAFDDQVRQVMGNIGAVLRQAGSSFDEVVNCTVMLADMSHWEAFNKIYVGYFKEGRLPARSALGANGLARGAQVELECWAYHPAGARSSSSGGTARP